MIIETPFISNTLPFPLNAPTYAFFGVIAGRDLLTAPPENEKVPVAACAVADVAALSGSGTLEFDGVDFGTNVTKRVALTAQAVNSQNGIYDYVHTTGPSAYTLTRSSDFDSAAEVAAGAVVYVQDGETYGGAQLKVAPGAVLGTSNIVFQPYAPAYSAKLHADPTKPAFLNRVVYGVCIRSTNVANKFDVDFIVDGEILKQNQADPHSMTYTQSPTELTVSVAITPPVGYTPPSDPMIEWCAERDTELTFTFSLDDENPNAPPAQTYTRTLRGIQTEQLTYVHWVDDRLPSYTRIVDIYPRWWANVVYMTEQSVPTVSTSIRDPDAINTIAAMRAAIEAAMLAATGTASHAMDFYQEKVVERFITRCKAAGVWSLCDSLQMYCNLMPQVADPVLAAIQAEAMSQVDIKKATVMAAPNGAAFTPGVGYRASSATGYLDTGFTPSQGVKYRPGNSSMGVFVPWATTGTFGGLCGADDGGSDAVSMVTAAGQDLTFVAQSTSHLVNDVDASVLSGLMVVGRLSGPPHKVHFHTSGGYTVSYTDTPIADRPTVPVYVCNVNDGVANQGSSNKPVAGFVAGGYMSASKVKKLGVLMDSYRIAMNSPHQ